MRGKLCHQQELWVELMVRRIFSIPVSRIQPIEVPIAHNITVPTLLGSPFPQNNIPLRGCLVSAASKNDISGPRQ
jgi:hypothetical protein